METEVHGDGIAGRQFRNTVVSYIPMIWIDTDAIKLGGCHLQLNQQVLSLFLARVADGYLGIDSEFRVVGIGRCRHLIVTDMHQWPYPQLHAAEDTRQPPHVLILQITAVAPAVHLDGEFVFTLTQILRHVKLRRRHRVLAVAHLLAVDPEIHRRMHTAEMQNEILRKHILGDIDECHILSHGIAVLVGRPVLGRFCRHAWTILHKRVVDINVNRRAVALRLPVARNVYLPPTAHVVVLAIEICRTALRVFRPMEQPLSVQTHDFLAILFLRR